MQRREHLRRHYPGCSGIQKGQLATIRAGVSSAWAASETSCRRVMLMSAGNIFATEVTPSYFSGDSSSLVYFLFSEQLAATELVVTNAIRAKWLYRFHLHIGVEQVGAIGEYTVVRHQDGVVVGNEWQQTPRTAPAFLRAVLRECTAPREITISRPAALPATSPPPQSLSL